MEELTKQEEIEAIRQAQAEKLTPAQLKEELETSGQYILEQEQTTNEVN